MSLRYKIVLALFFVALVYGIVVARVQNKIIWRGFERLEHQEATEAITRCTAAVNREVRQLDAYCFDAAAWDDSYHYVAEPYPEYEEANLRELWFTENNYDLLYILDTTGRVVWGKVFDTEKEAVVDMPEFPTTSWPVTHQLLRISTPESRVCGILNTSQGLMILAARPILTSLKEGPIRGVMIYGRFMRDDIVEVLREQAQVDFAIKPLAPMTLTEKDKAVLARITPDSPYVFEPLDAKWLAVSAVVNGIDGKPVLLLTAQVLRDITDKGHTAVRFSLLSILFASLAVLLVILIALRRFVVDPLTRLITHITKVTGEENLVLLDMPPRGDEIGTLSSEFNRMVRRIQSDNSRRKIAENALRESEARVRTILEAAPDGIVTMDAAGHVESFNAAAEQIFQCPQAQAAGRPIREFVTAASEQGALQEAVPPSNIEAMGLRADGTTFPLHWTLGQAAIGDRTIYTGMVRDISGLKEMHERVSRMERLAMIGEMGASVAHEIRNPLAAISGAIQVLRDELSPEDDRREIMDDLLVNVQRMDGIIRRLLMFARSWECRKQPADLRQIAGRLCKEARTRQKYDGVRMALNGATELVAAVDPALVEQVLWNLMDNAVQAMESMADGKPRLLEWSFEDNGTRACVRLRDNGCGISAENLAKLFQPFHTTKLYGTGLGLLICRRIMEAHGGTLNIESTPGSGTEVALEFPKD